MKRIQQTIDDYRAHLEAAQRFLDQFGPNMPDDFPGYLNFYDVAFGNGGAKFTMAIPERLQNDGNRETLLSAAGDIFGRNGWMRILSHDRSAFHWQKILPVGVTVIIKEVEKLDDPRDKTPVLPKEFPVMLTWNEDESGQREVQPIKEDDSF